jgi:hypothetical protein
MTRLALAFKAFWQTLVNPDFAASVARLSQDERLTSPVVREEIAPKPAAFQETAPEAALQLLSLLQQEGRFLDFLEENVSGFSDAEIGGAARVVHEGCRKALREHLALEPVRTETEGIRLTLEEGFDASAVRLTGNVVGTPPFSGTLIHRGWRVTEIKLPKVAAGHDLSVLAPAEVEL